MTIQENDFKLRLKELKKQKCSCIELSLYPGTGFTTISKSSVNRAFINEGRLGKFNDISESFYDEMVDKYDTRYKRSKR